MPICETCGNDYPLTFEVVVRDQKHTFDSFECAIHKLAPICAHCSCRIIGHGVERDAKFFCCSHCADASVEAVSAEVT